MNKENKERITAAPLVTQGMGIPNGDFIVVEWSDPGGPPGPPRYMAPLHVHHQDDEAWYVLEGTLCVQAGDSVIEAHTGSGVFVPKGTKHTYWNPSTGPLSYLLIMTSAIHRLIEEIHMTAERSPEKMKALFEKYNSELLE